MRRGAVALLAALALAGPAFAVAPGEQLADPALEARAVALSRELRCLVCQNQSIEDSDAELARDLRLIVRERLTAGDTDAQAKQYVVKRYGDFVLLRPPVKGSTLALWLGPFVLALAGAAAIGAYLRGRRPVAVAPPLDLDDEARVDRLLRGELRP